MPQRNTLLKAEVLDSLTASLPKAAIMWSGHIDSVDATFDAEVLIGFQPMHFCPLFVSRYVRP